MTRKCDIDHNLRLSASRYFLLIKVSLKLLTKTTLTFAVKHIAKYNYHKQFGYVVSLCVSQNKYIENKIN